MRIAVIAIVFVAVVGGLFLWAFSPSTEPVSVGSSDGPAPTGSTGSTGRARPTDSERGSLLDNVKVDRDTAAEREPPRRQLAPPDPALREDHPDAQNPLKGLEVSPLTSSDLRERGVPDDFESGVLVTSVEPDSPADEVRLVPGDVIVQAQLLDVKEPSDLQRIVSEREYAKVTFVRNGQVLQVVLKRPFFLPPEQVRK